MHCCGGVAGGGCFLVGNCRNANGHKPRKEQGHHAQNRPCNDVAHEKRAYTHDGIRKAEYLKFARKCDAAALFERFDIRAIHAGFANPGMQARRAFREQERRQKHEGRCGQQGNEYADASKGETYPGDNEEEDSFHSWPFGRLQGRSLRPFHNG